MKKATKPELEHRVEKLLAENRELRSILHQRFQMERWVIVAIICGAISYILGYTVF